jgi:hypothetical protein
VVPVLLLPSAIRRASELSDSIHVVTSTCEVFVDHLGHLEVRVAGERTANACCACASSV